MLFEQIGTSYVHIWIVTAIFQLLINKSLKLLYRVHKYFTRLCKTCWLLVPALLIFEFYLTHIHKWPSKACPLFDRKPIRSVLFSIRQIDKLLHLFDRWNKSKEKFYRIKRFQACEKGSMAESWQGSRAFKSQILVAHNDGQMWIWYKFERVPRVAISHHEIDYYLQSTFPVYWLAKQ